MKKDIIYFKDTNTFYQMTNVTESRVFGHKINNDSDFRSDYLLCRLGEGGRLNYIDVHSDRSEEVCLRDKSGKSVKVRFDRIKRKKKSVTIDFYRVWNTVHTGHTGPTGPTGSLGASGFSKIAVPLVRQMYPKTIAKDLISVMPMDKPITPHTIKVDKNANNGNYYTSRCEDDELADVLTKFLAGGYKKLL